jgi:hypothetical protein
MGSMSWTYILKAAHDKGDAEEIVTIYCQGSHHSQ